MNVKTGYANLRKGRFTVAGAAYHVVFSTQNRRPEFLDFNSARQLTRFLKMDSELGNSQTLAFVVMPDHIHWLVIVKSGSLSNAVQRVKSMYSRYVGEKLWNKGFYDHGIRGDEDLHAVARYIVANPLRAGLVARLGDYPHWDAVWLR